MNMQTMNEETQKKLEIYAERFKKGEISLYSFLASIHAIEAGHADENSIEAKILTGISADYRTLAILAN